MAAFAKNRIDDAGERGFGAAGGASLALHGGVAALLIGLTWLTLREPLAEREPEPGAFRMIEAGGASEVMTDARARAETASEAERLFVPPPSVRSWMPPPPPPRVSEQSESRPPARTEPTRASRVISYAEYLHSQGTAPSVRRPRTSTAAAVAPTGPGTRINVDQVRGEPGVGAVSQSASDGAVASGMDGYFGDLVGRLRDAHELPGGVSDLLSAEVQFTLAANGVVSGVRIVRSSGSKDFDQSVLEAFGRLKMPARPDKKTDVQRLTFRIKVA